MLFSVCSFCSCKVYRYITACITVFYFIPIYLYWFSIENKLFQFSAQLSFALIPCFLLFCVLMHYMGTSRTNHPLFIFHLVKLNIHHGNHIPMLWAEVSQPREPHKLFHSKRGLDTVWYISRKINNERQRQSKWMNDTTNKQ